VVLALVLLLSYLLTVLPLPIHPHDTMLARGCSIKPSRVRVVSFHTISVSQYPLRSCMCRTTRGVCTSSLSRNVSIALSPLPSPACPSISAVTSIRRTHCSIPLRFASRSSQSHISSPSYNRGRNLAPRAFWYTSPVVSLVAGGARLCVCPEFLSGRFDCAAGISDSGLTTAAVHRMLIPRASEVGMPDRSVSVAELRRKRLLSIPAPDLAFPFPSLSLSLSRSHFPPH